MVNIMCCWEAVFVQWLSPVQTLRPHGLQLTSFPCPGWEATGDSNLFDKTDDPDSWGPIELTVYYPVLIPGLSENVNSNKLLLQPRPWLALWSHFQDYPFLMEFFFFWFGLAIGPSLSVFFFLNEICLLCNM